MGKEALTQDKIRFVTKQYWDEDFEGKLLKQLEWYISFPSDLLGNRSLLEAEIEYARKIGSINVEPCKTLVLLVGFSLEPLLQTIIAYRPETLILLVNKDGYGPKMSYQKFSEYFQEAVRFLKKANLIPKTPKFREYHGIPGYPVSDRPEAVFRALLEILEDTTDIVIDVTGGKKSMVTGAYLYAAYAGVRISYVDFDEYDPRRRRPYGYSCRIGELTNPYKTFALREWELIRTLYGRWQFREARLLLEEGGETSQRSVLAAMREYLPESVPSLQLLARIFRCYELWDAGMYKEAASEAEEIQKELPEFTPPSGVELLGRNWFEPKQGRFEGGPQDFYADTPAFRAYVLDEIARIQRLIDNERYRAAFLRAASLNEALMVARLVRLVEKEHERQLLLNALQKKTPAARNLFKQLTKGPGTKLSIDPKKGDIKFEGAPTIEVTLKEPMDWWKDLSLFDCQDQDSWEAFIKRRNDITHKYYSPPRKWAEDALSFVLANVVDFYGESLDRLMAQHHLPLPWTKLCALTKIKGYLPPNLRQEA